ncbi:hypothetical protein J4219_03675 [Candidatus Woesearchaeota archaeon]|nr:hypothetical protein [Candidatus Woesearchaeota archaeon]
MKKGGVSQLAVLVLLALALVFFAFSPSNGFTGLQTVEENALPVYSGGSFDAVPLEPVVIDLSAVFSDPEGAQLAFSSSSQGVVIDGLSDLARNPASA